MARILNTSVYPFKTPVSLNDYVIGTDSENSNQTKNFKVSDFLSLLEVVGLPNNIENGGIVYNENLDFIVIYF